MCDMPVHVDGEPWIQPAGQVVVLRSALKVHFDQLCTVLARSSIDSSIISLDTISGST